MIKEMNSALRAVLPPAALGALAALVLAAAVYLVLPVFAQSQGGPMAPSNLTAQFVNNAVVLIWDAPAKNASEVDGYEILRRRPNQDEDTLQTLVTDTGSTTTSYTDHSANEAGVRYTYRVKAIRGGERSEWSNYATVLLPDPVPEPQVTTTSTPEPEPAPEDPPPSDPIYSDTWDATTLTVDITGITGPNGLPNRFFSYRWVRLDGETQTLVGNDSATYTLVPEDEGKTIEVRVTLNDDTDPDESPTRDTESEAADVLVKNTGQAISSVNHPLNAGNPKIAQAFTTGTNAAGYDLDSVGIRFDAIADTSTAGGELTVSVNADSNGEPGDVHCSLADPGTFASDQVNAFTASDCTLESGTTFFVVAERANSNAGVISLRTTNSTTEDASTAPGWSIGDNRLKYAGSSNTWGTGTTPHLIEVRGSTINNLATGAPSIQGNLQQGETLTVGTADIADDDGIPADVTFTCYWMRVDGETASDISEASGCSYTIRQVDVGKGIQVQVTFTDGKGNAEILTSPVSVEVQGQETAVPGGSTITHVQLPPTVSLPQSSTVALVKNLGKTSFGTTEMTSAQTTLAQGFTTGWNVGGYTLASIDLRLRREGPSTGDLPSPDDYSVTLRANDGGKPGDSICTFVNPANIAFVTPLTNTVTFTAPIGLTACPTLDPRTTYFVALKRLNFETDGEVKWFRTDSKLEDSGAAGGWSIADNLYVLKNKWTLITGIAGIPEIFKMGINGSAVSTPAGITVSETALEVEEGDSSGDSYTVRLDAKPTASVTVTIGGHINTDVSVSNSTPTFTTGNWGREQTIRVTGLEDDDAVDDAVVTLTHTGGGAAEYTGVTGGEVEVTITENDTAGVTVSKSSLTVSEGGSEEYTIVLDTEPSEDVMVNISGHGGTDFTVSPASLTFTPLNWRTRQSVEVGLEHDADSTVEGDVTLSHSLTTTAAEYGSVTVDSVMLSATEDDFTVSIQRPPGAPVSPLEGDSLPFPGHPEPHRGDAPDRERRARRRGTEHHERPGDAGHNPGQPDPPGFHG